MKFFAQIALMFLRARLSKVGLILGDLALAEATGMVAGGVGVSTLGRTIGSMDLTPGIAAVAKVAGGPASTKLLVQLVPELGKRGIRARLIGDVLELQRFDGSLNVHVAKADETFLAFVVQESVEVGPHSYGGGNVGHVFDILAAVGGALRSLGVRAQFAVCQGIEDYNIAQAGGLLF